MSTSKNSIIGLILFTISFCIIFSGKETDAQNKIRIGVYDSRAVAIAYYNSKYSNAQQIFGEIKNRMNEAQEKKDTLEIKDIEREANLRQAFLHQLAFGKGSVSNILETVKDKINEVSKNENLDILVSKWELNFNSPNAEIIDVTDKIADLFEPSEKVKAWLLDLKNQEPIIDAYLVKD